MPVRPTLDIMSSGHNISGAGLLTPLGVGTIGARVTKLAMCWCGLVFCRIKIKTLWGGSWVTGLTLVNFDNFYLLVKNVSLLVVYRVG